LGSKYRSSTALFSKNNHLPDRLAFPQPVEPLVDRLERQQLGQWSVPFALLVERKVSLSLLL